MLQRVFSCTVSESCSVLEGGTVPGADAGFREVAVSASAQNLSPRLQPRISNESCVAALVTSLPFNNMVLFSPFLICVVTLVGPSAASVHLFSN